MSRREPKAKIQEVTKEVGKVYKTNNCGDVKVLEYMSTKNITIQFVGSGNIYQVQKDALEKGLVKDTNKWLKDIEDRDNNIKAEKERIKKERIDCKLDKLRKKKEVKLKEAERIRDERIEKKVLEKTQTYKALIGQTYCHSYFGEYKVINFDFNKSPLNTLVKFSISGFETWANKGVVLRGSVYDKTREDEEGWKVITSLLRAKAYIDNREFQLSKAKQWQKDNPEKCRVKNQNRRAKRFNLGGQVSLTELNSLMEKQNHKCANCGDLLTRKNKHLDHIMPIALQGTGNIDNLQWLCSYCNLSKNDKHPDLWKQVVSNKEWWEIKARSQSLNNPSESV